MNNLVALDLEDEQECGPRDCATAQDWFSPRVRRPARIRISPRSLERAPTSTFLSNVISWRFNDVAVRLPPSRQLTARRCGLLDILTEVPRVSFMACRLPVVERLQFPLTPEHNAGGTHRSSLRTQEASASRTLSFALMILLTATLARAQTTSATTSTVTGTVTDQQGGVLPGVTATLSGPAMMGVQTQVSDEVGLYRFVSIPPGEYKLVFELSGFATRHARRHQAHRWIHCDHQHADGRGDAHGKRPGLG